MEVVKLGTHTLISNGASSSSLTPFIRMRMRMRSIPPTSISERARRRRNSLRHKLHHLNLQVHSPIPTPHNNNNVNKLQDVDVGVIVEGEDKNKDKDKDEVVCDLVASQITHLPTQFQSHFSTTITNLSTFALPLLSSFLFLKLFFTLFTTSTTNDKDMSPLHREMLRRKIKSRMHKSLQHQHHEQVQQLEQEHNQKQAPSVGVELVVVEDKSTITPPSLDHSLLLHTIRSHPHSHPPTMDIHPTTTWAPPPHLNSLANIVKHQHQPTMPNNNVPITTLRKPKLILSLHQAREYLSHKLHKTHLSNHSSTPYTSLQSVLASHIPIEAANSNEGSIIVDHIPTNLKNEATQVNLDPYDQIHATPNPVNPYPTANSQGSSSKEEDAAFPIQQPYEQDFSKNDGGDQTTLDFGNMGGSRADNQTWLQTNFHEVEPIVNKIGSGFRDNYMMAREKVKQQDISLDFLELESIKDDTELDWMQNDKLREIVFRVRDNELAGRDPFHSIDPEDKMAFFNGLESKVQKENEKLSTLHSWLHSNIENIDYGADGISLYDPPDKVVPRWKGPLIDKIPEFLTKPAEQPKVASSVQKANESAPLDKTKLSQANSTPNEVAKISKTIIEASDGSIKPGRKSGKEYWQHTKKWSRGFLESYNAESDPEVKSAMKDIGKGLNRWITEEEIQEAAVFMDKIPQRGKEYIEKKLNKLKREMEQFGPAAVVSKYREYADEKEEDYLWWLDLRYVLCIELYTYVVKDQRVGFYSLEMASDLDLDPKPHHVIGFEDPGDCKNLCYIIQAHLEMLGSGRAFVVAQPPKDVFQQAKANGFGVTVIRKGELHLNIDQPLEEVEESITEIGSKMYHDKMMRERSVDISSLMKGVFGSSKPSKRRRRKRAQTNLRKL